MCSLAFLPPLLRTPWGSATENPQDCSVPRLSRVENKDNCNDLSVEIINKIVFHKKFDVNMTFLLSKEQESMYTTASN